MQSLERKVSELNHDDVQQLKQELQHLKARLTLAEESLASTTQAKLGLQQQIDDMKTEQQTNDWLAKEELADREAGLIGPACAGLGAAGEGNAQPATPCASSAWVAGKW